MGLQIALAAAPLPPLPLMPELAERALEPGAGTRAARAGSALGTLGSGPGASLAAPGPCFVASSSAAGLRPA